MDSLTACPPVRDHRAKIPLDRQLDMVATKITQPDSPRRLTIPLHQVVRPVLNRSCLESMAIAMHSSFGAGTSSFKLTADFNKQGGRGEDFAQAIAPSPQSNNADLSASLRGVTLTDREHSQQAPSAPRLSPRELQHRALLASISHLEGERGLQVDYVGASVKVSPRTTRSRLDREDGSITPRRGRAANGMSPDITALPSDSLRSLPATPRRPDIPATVAAFRNALLERERILRDPSLISPSGGLAVRAAGARRMSPLPQLDAGCVVPVASITFPGSATAHSSSGRSLLATTSRQMPDTHSGAVSNAPSMRHLITTKESVTPHVGDVTLAGGMSPGGVLEGVVVVEEEGFESSSPQRLSEPMVLDPGSLSLVRQATEVAVVGHSVSPKGKPGASPLKPQLIPSQNIHGQKSSSLRSVQDQLAWHLSTSASGLIPTPTPPPPAPAKRAVVVDPRDDGDLPAAFISVTSSQHPSSHRKPSTNLLSHHQGGQLISSRRNSMTSTNTNGGATPGEAAAAEEARHFLRHNEGRLLGSELPPVNLVRAVGPKGGDMQTRAAVYALSSPRGARDLFVPAPPPASSAHHGPSPPGTSASLTPSQSAAGWGGGSSFALHPTLSRSGASPSFKSPGAARSQRMRAGSLNGGFASNGGRLTATNTATSPSRHHQSRTDNIATGESSSPTGSDLHGALGLGGNSAVAAVIPPVSHAGAYSSSALQPVFRRGRPMTVVYANAAQ